MDQTFAIKLMVEEYLGNGVIIYAAFMDLEKASDRIDWNVLKSYGGWLLAGAL